jgi:hypothetical protein
MLHDVYSAKKGYFVCSGKMVISKTIQQFFTVNNTPGNWVSTFEAFWQCFLNLLLRWPNWQTPKRKIEKIYPCYNVPGHSRFCFAK